MAGFHVTFRSGVEPGIEGTSARVANRLVEFLEPVNLGLCQTSRGVEDVFVLAQKGGWIPLAILWVGDDLIFLSIEAVTLPENLWPDHVGPEVGFDVTAGVGGHMRSPYGGGSKEAVPVDPWGPGDNPVKVFRVSRRDRDPLPPARGTTVVVGMMWIGAIVRGGNLLPDFRCNVYRTVREVLDGFLHLGHKEGLFVQVPVVTVVRPDCGKM